MAKLKFCVLVIAIFALLLSFSLAVPIVKDNDSSGEYEVLSSKKENSIASFHQKEDPSSEHFIGKKRNLLSMTPVTDHASSIFSLGITKANFDSNPSTTNFDASYEYTSTTPHPTNSQGTALTSEQSKKAISSSTGKGKEVTTMVKRKDITTAAQTEKHGTEFFLLSLTSTSTSKPIAMNVLENSSDNVEESPKSQAKDYRNKVQSTENKFLDPVKDINSNQGKTAIYSKESTVSEDNMFTTPTFSTFPTAAAHNLVPVEVRSNQSYKSSTLAESMKRETELKGPENSNPATGTANPVTSIKVRDKENFAKIISSQNDDIPLFVQKLFSLKNDSEVKLSRKKLFEVKENISSQTVKKGSLNETKSTSPTTEIKNNLQNTPATQTNTNLINLLPLLFSSSQVKNNSNASGTNSVEDVLGKATESVAEITESSTAPAIIGKIKRRQEETVNQEHQTPTNEDVLPSTKKFIPPELNTNNNVLEYLIFSTRQDDKDVTDKNNITDKQNIILHLKDNNKNETLATKETRNKETIMDEYTRFVLSHYFDIGISEKDSNISNLSSQDLFYANEVQSPEPIKANIQNGTDSENNITRSDTNKHMDLFFLTVFSSWANNYSTGSTDNSSEEDPTFMSNTMIAEFTTRMTIRDGSRNGTTDSNKTGFNNLAQNEESSIQGITADFKDGIIIKDGSKNSTIVANKTELQKLVPKYESFMPRSYDELTTAITIKRNMENNRAVKIILGFQNLTQSEVSSIPGITAEVTSEITVTSDMEKDAKVANENGLEKLMKEDANSSLNEGDLQGSKLNHISLSKNVLETSEVQGLFKNFHDKTVTNKTVSINLAHVSSIPGITAELTTAITKIRDLKNSTKSENENELQNLAKKDASSVPGLTAEITAGFTVATDLENTPNLANKNGLEKLMQENTSSKPKKDDLEGFKLNHIPLSKNVSKMSEMLELFNSFYLPSIGLLEQREEVV